MIDRDYKLVTVFGGGGFIGRYVCEYLLDESVRIRVASREPRHAHFLQPLAQVGQWGSVRASVTNEASVRSAVEGAFAVVNLVGSFRSAAAINARGAGTIAKAAREAGVQSFVHISAIGADPNAQSDYARSKGEGERVVRDAFPTATIMRPSIVFGPEDILTNRLAGLSRFPALPVIAPGAKFQPVFVEDLAKAISAAAIAPQLHGGKTYEIAGPQVLTMRQLTLEILKAAGRDTALVDVPSPVASAMSRLGFLPGAPITRDQWLMLQTDNVASDGSEGLAAFGIKPTPLGAVGPLWLGQYGGSRFARRRVNLTATN